MEAFNAQPSQCQVEHCHVAEPDDPFWLLAQAAEVDEWQQPYRAVPALEADDGFHAGIVTPARKLSEKADTAKVRERFESWGLKVKFGPHTADREQPYFAGVTMPTVSPGRR